MITIRANDFIESGFSADDAKLMARPIDAIKDSDTKIVIDFSDVQYFTTLFFSSALTHLIGILGKEEYMRRLEVTNLSESGEETYRHALDYAIEYYEKTQEERENASEIIDSVMEDV